MRIDRVMYLLSALKRPRPCVYRTRTSSQGSLWVPRSDGVTVSGVVLTGSILLGGTGSGTEAAVPAGDLCGDFLGVVLLEEVDARADIRAGELLQVLLAPADLRLGDDRPGRGVHQEFGQPGLPELATV